jgi:hypothetical protein
MPIKKRLNFLIGIAMRARMPRRNAKHFGGKAKSHFGRSQQIKIASMQFLSERVCYQNCTGLIFWSIA